MADDFTEDDVETLARIMFDGIYYTDWAGDAEAREDCRLAARAALRAGYRRGEAEDR